MVEQDESACESALWRAHYNSLREVANRPKPTWTHFAKKIVESSFANTTPTQRSLYRAQHSELIQTCINFRKVLPITDNLRLAHLYQSQLSRVPLANVWWNGITELSKSAQNLTNNLILCVDKTHIELCEVEKGLPKTRMDTYHGLRWIPG